MKKFIARVMFVFLTLSATLSADILKDDYKDFIKNKISDLQYQAQQLDNELFPYIHQKDYELGYLNGQIDTYKLFTEY